MLYTILLVILILMLLGALPTWPYSTGWGYYPSRGRIDNNYSSHFIVSRENLSRFFKNHYQVKVTQSLS